MILGGDISGDRSVSIRIVALPGEEPLPNEVLDGPTGPVGEEGGG